MNEENYLYFFTNKKDEVLYVGITNNMDKRMKQHFSKNGHLPKECYKSVDRINYSAHTSRNEVMLYERYYISKIRPKYNVSMKNGGEINIDLPKPITTAYKKTEVIDKYWGIEKEDFFSEKEEVFLRKVVREFGDEPSDVPRERVEAIANLFGMHLDKMLGRFEYINN